MNRGSAASGNFVIRFWLDGNKYTDINAPSFNPNQGDLAWVDFPNGLPAGDHRIDVCLDADSQVEEIYETNNCTWYGIKVWPAF